MDQSMGLDITAFGELSPAPDAELDEDGCPLEFDRFVLLEHDLIRSTEENFPGRTAGTKPGVYSFRQSSEFRAGSYGGYNEWRDRLARMAHGKSAERVWENERWWKIFGSKIFGVRIRRPGPFVELIYFPDNEGLIGPLVATKLAKDFAGFEKRAEAFSTSISDGADWLDRYHDWKRAFEIASDNGAVILQ
jgi:hypothetical protein